MTKPEPFDEATAQWVYEVFRNGECKHGKRHGEFPAYNCVITDHFCRELRTNCPLFKESEQE